MPKPTANIPRGVYCYDGNGVCPYWSLDSDKPKQDNGYCAYLELGDWDPSDGGYSTILWDQVKECGPKIKDGDPEEIL